MKVQIAYKYSNAEGEFKGYDVMDYGGSFSEENFEDDAASIAITWMSSRDEIYGTTHECRYDYGVDELYFEEFKNGEKVGTLIEVEIELPSLGIVFKL